MGNTSKRDVWSVNDAHRRVEALEFRKQGLSNQAIGDRMGITETAVRKLIARALRDANLIAGQARDDYIASELENIDRDEQRAERMIARRIRLYEQKGAAGQDVVLSDKDARIVLEAMEKKRACRQERAKYLQLYAPERKELTGKDGEAIQVQQLAPVIMIPPERTDDDGASESSGAPGAPTGLAPEPRTTD